MQCVNCSNGVAFGCKHCVACLQKAKIRSSENYKKLKLERKCKSCRNAVDSIKGVYCKSCKQKQKDTNSKRKNSGMCVTCGKNNATQGVKCYDCYLSYKENLQRKKSERLSSGLCAYCDEVRVGVKLCLKHYLQCTAKTHFKGQSSLDMADKLHQLYLRQDGKCPYTGNKLILGKDASLDHIIPRSRGGSGELDNVQWVYYAVNFMKQDMFHDEFLELVKDIYIFNSAMI